MISSTLSDGTGFQPFLAIDAATVVGIATSPDLTTSRLVIRSGDGNVRVLRAWQGGQGPSVVAVAKDGDQLFWLELSEDDDGHRQTTLWRAGLSGGRTRQLATDGGGELLYYDSAYDLQIAGGKVYWAAAGAEGGGEIHSVPVDGGKVTVRQFDRLYALSAWPWVTSSAGARPGNVELLNLSTGEQRTVPAGPSEILTCTPVWCRVTTLINQGQSIRFEAEHSDGTARQKTGTGSMTPVNTDVALLDRFEAVSATAASGSAGYTQQTVVAGSVDRQNSSGRRMLRAAQYQSLRPLVRIWCGADRGPGIEKDRRLVRHPIWKLCSESRCLGSGPSYRYGHRRCWCRCLVGGIRQE